VCSHRQSRLFHCSILICPPSRAVREGEECPSSPGSDLHIEAIAGEAGRRLLESPETWFNPTRDAWLDINNKGPSELWLYAIREFWLNAEEEAEDAGATGEFANVAEADGYCHTRNAQPVGEHVWRKMVRSKQSLGDSLQELGLSVVDQIGEYEEPAGWIHTGCIKHAFRACAYFCGVLAARRGRELEKIAGAEAAGSSDAPDNRNGEGFEHISKPSRGKEGGGPETPGLLERLSPEDSKLSACQERISSIAGRFSWSCRGCV
jgi:hypothetical protein